MIRGKRRGVASRLSAAEGRSGEARLVGSPNCGCEDDEEGGRRLWVPLVGDVVPGEGHTQPTDDRRGGRADTIGAGYSREAKNEPTAVR